MKVVDDNIFPNNVRDLPHIASNGRGEGGSAKSDFISKWALIKHLMRGGQKMAKII